ncbi:MAG TPA: sugar ABC transporter substrate-binding protein [Arachnia sp.]|nr:sugar ABC transporter substrate-binding protein [Arachnia sp.]HMT87620.1 sugar ABC transporter substrate-binding protein [Arachnia sp.]
MRLRRRVVAALCLIPLTLAGAACAPGEVISDDDDGSNGAAESVEPVDPADFAGETLEYMYFTDGPDESATRELIGKFEEQYDVTVNLQIMPYADLITSALNRLSAGNAPDVIRLTALTDFRGDLLVLDPYLGADYKNEFLPGPQRGVVNANGELIAVPSDLTLNGMFVNLDLFESAGVEVPETWTWDEMLELGKQVKDATGVPYSYVMDKSGHRVSTVLSQHGTFMLDANGNALDQEKATKALQRLADLMATDDMPRDFWLGSGSRYEGANEIFLAGETPLYMSGNWQVGQFVQNATFNWAAASNPCDVECGGFPGGKYMAAFQQSKNPALAAEFIRFMNETENQELFVTTSGQLPTRADLSEAGVTYPDPKAQAAMDVFLADLVITPSGGFEANGNPAFSPSATELVEELAAVVGGQKDVPTAVADLSDSIDALVEETSS